MNLSANRGEDIAPCSLCVRSVGHSSDNVASNEVQDYERSRHERTFPCRDQRSERARRDHDDDDPERRLFDGAREAHAVEYEVRGSRWLQSG